MKNSSKSILVFGFYLVGMGVGFIAMPNVLLNILGFPPTNEVWSRVVGVLALSLAFYYIQAARANLTLFVQWTVYTRIAGVSLFTGFTVLNIAGPMMILLGSVDLVFALWTEGTLRKEKKQNPQPGTLTKSVTTSH
ncbi:MAG: hypothetical protein HC806_01535 [Anaerolineae bacterium]|nr:hypothetical protein [Anaerolineae bacterium]